MNTMVIENRDPVYFEDLRVGMSASMYKVVTDRDIEMFAEVSMDHNPLHLDDDYAAGTMFKGRIAHGIIAAGLVSAVIGNKLPGHGTVYLRQSLNFLAPVRPGDEVEAQVKVLTIHEVRHRVTLETRCLVGDRVVLKGEALVLPPSRS